jgi:hypothetical protein
MAGVPLTTDQPVVIRMATDPYPGYCAGVHDAECTVVVANSNGDQILASLKVPKAQRRMRRIGLPKTVVLFGEALSFVGQVVEQPPKSLASSKTSPARRPVFQEVVFPVCLRFLAQKIELASRCIGIELLIPAFFLNSVDALRDLTEFVRAQLFYGAFDFFDTAHCY